MKADVAVTARSILSSNSIDARWPRASVDPRRGGWPRAARQRSCVHCVGVNVVLVEQAEQLPDRNEAVRERLAQDALTGTHPARDRTFERYLELEAGAEPLPEDALRIDTSRTPLPACVSQCRARIARSSAG